MSVMLLYYFFLISIWLDHGQIWAIIERTASPTPMLITAFYHFDVKVTMSLVN